MKNMLAGAGSARYLADDDPRMLPPVLDEDLPRLAPRSDGAGDEEVKRPRYSPFSVRTVSDQLLEIIPRRNR